jgi:hypothetical protein
MASPFTVILPAGRAGFESVVLCWNESPEHVFSVELMDQSVLYGIWRPRWAPNENDLDVEVVSFGWADKRSTGNSASQENLSAAKAVEAFVPGRSALVGSETPTKVGA